MPEADAELVFWLLPHFHRWVQIRTVQHHLGGDLSLRQLTVLFLVRTQMATPSELARRLMVSPTVLTGVIDRLEQRDFLRRAVDPTDRRRLRLTLTEEGRRISLAVERALVAEVAAQVAALTPAEQAELGRGLVLLERVVRRLEATTPPADERIAEQPDGP